MKIRRLASSHGVGPSLWKSQMAALGRGRAVAGLVLYKDGTAANGHHR